MFGNIILFLMTSGRIFDLETLNPEKTAVAVGIWNRYFVESFKRDVNGTFENSWGRETKFFDAVTQIQTDLLGSGKTYKP